MVSGGDGHAGDVEAVGLLAADGAHLVDDDRARKADGVGAAHVEEAEDVRAVAHVSKPRIALREHVLIRTGTRKLVLAVRDDEAAARWQGWCGRADAGADVDIQQNGAAPWVGGLVKGCLGAAVPADHDAIVGK